MPGWVNFQTAKGSISDRRDHSAKTGTQPCLPTVSDGMERFTVDKPPSRSRDFIEQCRERNITPHVADKKRGSMLDARTTRRAGYRISERVRKRVEEIFGWEKTIGGLRKTRFKGRARTQLAAYIVGAAYNLLRMAKLLMQPA